MTWACTAPILACVFALFGVWFCFLEFSCTWTCLHPGWTWLLCACILSCILNPEFLCACFLISFVYVSWSKLPWIISWLPDHVSSGLVRNSLPFHCWSIVFPCVSIIPCLCSPVMLLVVAWLHPCSLVSLLYWWICLVWFSVLLVHCFSLHLFVLLILSDLAFCISKPCSCCIDLGQPGLCVWCWTWFWTCVAWSVLPCLHFVATLYIHVYIYMYVHRDGTFHVIKRYFFGVHDLVTCSVIHCACHRLYVYLFFSLNLKMMTNNSNIWGKHNIKHTQYFEHK